MNYDISSRSRLFGTACVEDFGDANFDKANIVVFGLADCSLAIDSVIPDWDGSSAHVSFIDEGEPVGKNILLLHCLRDRVEDVPKFEKTDRDEVSSALHEHPDTEVVANCLGRATEQRIYAPMVGFPKTFVFLKARRRTTSAFLSEGAT